jgi:hypothetical protein
MPHTHSRYMQDLGFNDIALFCGPGDLVVNGANGVITRNAAGDWSINQAASLTAIYAVNVAGMLQRRVGFFEDLQEQFGGAGIAGSADFQGRPDTIGSMNTGQQITPRTAFKLKGFKLLSFDVIYQISTANLTSQSLRVDQSNFVNGQVMAPTVVLAAGTNGLAVAFSANQYVTLVTLPTAQQIYRISEDSELWIELTVVTPVSSTFKLYGFDLDLEINYN